MQFEWASKQRFSRAFQWKVFYFWALGNGLGVVFQKRCMLPTSINKSLFRNLIDNNDV